MAPPTKSGTQVRGEPLQRLQSATPIVPAKKIRAETKGRKRNQIDEKTEPRVNKLAAISKNTVQAAVVVKLPEKKRLVATQSGGSAAATKKARLEKDDRHLVFDEAAEAAIRETEPEPKEPEVNQKLAIICKEGDPLSADTKLDTEDSTSRVNTWRHGVSILRNKDSRRENLTVAFCEKSYRISFRKDSLEWVSSPRCVLTKRHDGFNMYGMWRDNEMWESRKMHLLEHGNFDAFVDPLLPVLHAAMELDSDQVRFDADPAMDHADDDASSTSSGSVELTEMWPMREEYDDDQCYEVDLQNFESHFIDQEQRTR